MKMLTSHRAMKPSFWLGFSSLIALPVFTSTLQAQVPVFTTLVEFTGTSGTRPGRSPMSGLYLASDGAFYGTTRYGGSMDVGTVFKMTAAGAFTSLFSF